MRELYKEVTIGDCRYRIAKMDALDSSWIVGQLLTKMLPSMIGQQVDSELGEMPAGRSEISRRDFRSMQSLALACCCRYDDTAGQMMPVPIWMDSVGLVHEDLKTDVVAVMSLTVHSILFSVAPFFVGDGLKLIMESFQALNPSATPQ